MPDLSLIMLGAGNSTRFEHDTKKQWLRFGDTPLWLYATQNILKNHKFDKIIVATHKNEIEYMKKYSSDFIFIEGGESRQESLQNALLQVSTAFVLVSDVARVFISDDMLERIIEQKEKADIIVPYLSVNDTVVYDNKTIDRQKVKLIQTPQLSKTKILKEALNTKVQYTDDSSAIKAMGGIVTYVKGDKKAKKLTFLEDLDEIAKNHKVNQDIFTGHGFDVHAFEDGKAMMLCGVKIQKSPGFKAHSDGDVAIHALIDSLLGAIGAGDIGELFPDTDAKYENIDSKKLLKKVYNFVTQVGYEIINCDITIMAQTPKLGKFKDKMRKTIANILQIKPIYVNIKATTTEKLGFIGRSEGIGVQASSNLKFLDWKNR
ncbi:MAG: bifunctional 2-C-methyl-D-erythritol 4-phosphate cytidylyltransferase/2-C-methyl-D-erythritol 2,4-cyclodiphosphate synthase [Epsilonproteobacteria bacterium]|nr:bifunctional 2-C-methyl-D-erythritol 4-phosphate cytidylyltransferase/2-C-methyl-D-erythritol 2,4-cyclodiphosphate synthase [Campylobacterota bacterium]